MTREARASVPHPLESAALLAREGPAVERRAAMGVIEEWKARSCVGVAREDDRKG